MNFPSLNTAVFNFINLGRLFWVLKQKNIRSLQIIRIKPICWHPLYVPRYIWNNLCESLFGNVFLWILYFNNYEKQAPVNVVERNLDNAPECCFWSGNPYRVLHWWSRINFQNQHFCYLWNVYVYYQLSYSCLGATMPLCYVHVQ